MNRASIIVQVAILRLIALSLTIRGANTVIKILEMAPEHPLITATYRALLADYIPSRGRRLETCTGCGVMGSSTGKDMPQPSCKILAG